MTQLGTGPQGVVPPLHAPPPNQYKSNSVVDGHENKTALILMEYTLGIRLIGMTM